MSDTAFILIIAHDLTRADELTEQLRRTGNACRIVSSPDEALDSIRTRQPDVVVADDELIGSDGLKVLRESKRLAPDAEIVVLGNKRLASDKGPSWSELGVFSCLAKDVDPEETHRVVVEAAERAKSNQQNRMLREQARRRSEFEGIITGNEQMLRIIKMIRRIADSKLTVLILGESGTGKDLVARAIHANSPRSKKPYRAINCAGLNENLLESELFGHVKGAFTGAIGDRKGLFETVDGGTLFLDEVGDMPLAMQAKLLRVLENGEILPVGGNDIRRVDVRVVAATRRDIRKMVEANDFRDDLFYRLNQAILRIPPLRERREDIPLLIESFLEQAAKTHDKKVVSVTPEVVRRLSAHQWPGNARELRSVIDQMVVLAESARLGLDDLPEHVQGSTDIVLASGPTTAGLTMEQMERIHIANTLKLTGGNREKTAQMLGIGARTLYRKLREYGL